MQRSVEGDEQTSGAAAPLSPGRQRLARLLIYAERVPWRIVGAVVGLALFGTALVVLQRFLSDVRYADVERALGEVGWQQVGYSLLLTAFSYAALTGYDFFALRHIGRKEVPYRNAALASFTGYALSYTIGFQVFVAAAVRYRAYAAAGLSAAEVAGITLVSGLTFWLGIAFVLGLGLTIEAEELTFLDALGPLLNRTIGIAILLAVGLYLVWLMRKPRAVMAAGFRLPLPGFRSTLAQIGIGFADIIGVAGALYVLLPEGGGVAFPTFAAIFIVAIALGMLSHAPGGAGVIEATLLVALPSVPADQLIASILLWRLVYYLLPFTIALALLAGVELSHRRGFLARTGVVLAVTLRPVAPVVLGVAVFVGGGALLILNTLPAGEERLAILQGFLPLTVVEAAHIAASLVGVALIVLARGLFGRLASAYWLARWLIPVGIVAALLKGLDWEAAAILAAAYGLILVNRRAFWRRGALLADPVPAPWFAAVLTVFAGSIWLGFFAYAHVEAPNLWTEFAWNSDASRFLRSSLAAGCFAIVLTMIPWRLAARVARTPASVLPSEVAAIVATDERADANRALRGGSRLLMGEGKDAFILYDVVGRSWIARGDPIGAHERDAELAWAFRELADRHGGWPVFYEASEQRLPVYVELGLTTIAIAEEARLDLRRPPAFPPRPAERAMHRRRIEIALVPRAELGPLLPAMQDVFESWAADHPAAGARRHWDPAYFSRFDTIVGRQRGRLVGFGTLWRSEPGSEAELDVVRIRHDMPSSLIEAIILGAIAEARSQGLRWFNLGTAPLPEAPASDAPSIRPGDVTAFRHGEHFADAAALRRFKQSFSPRWRPRYLACPGGLALPQIIREVGLVAPADQPWPAWRIEPPRFGPNSDQ